MNAAARRGTLQRWAESLSRALGLLGLGILLAFAVATLLDGTLRAVLSKPIDAVRDLGGLIVAISIACCVPLGLLERSNITIKILDLWLGRTASMVLDAIAAIALEIVLVFIAIEFYWFARDLAKAGEITLMLAIPKAPLWYVVDAVLWVAVLVQAHMAVVDVISCFRPEQRRSPGNDVRLIEDSM